MRKNMTHRKLSLSIVAGAAALFISLPPYARADLVDAVTVNTSALPSAPGSEIFFVLTDGSGTGDSLNTATLSSFGFGGGSAGAVDTGSLFGGVSGSMTSTVSLTETSFTNIFAQFFTAGSAISFNLDLTTNLQSGPTPDQFSLAILDPSANPIPTSDPTGDDNLLVININSSNPDVVSYSDLVTVTPTGAVATPEPRQLAFPIIVLISLALVGWRTRTSPQPLAPSPQEP
jgi:hypothetical protein